MIEFRADRPVWNDRLELYAKRTVDGQVMALTAQGIQADPITPGSLWPCFLDLPLQDNAGQSLFDALWAAGYRPNKGEASAAHVEAMRAHLSDMQRLVFKNK